MPKIIVILDRKRPIAWSNLARYRLGTLARPPQPRDLSHPQKAYTALLGFLWAMLAEPDDELFLTPASLAEFVDVERVGDLLKSVCAAFDAAGSGDKEKNAPGSTRLPSPASSSE